MHGSASSTTCSDTTRCGRSRSSAPSSSRLASTSAGWTSNGELNEGPALPSSTGPSLRPGISRRGGADDNRRMSAAVLAKVAPAGSLRLLADVKALDLPADEDVTRMPALLRLEATLGREFADRLVA